MLDPSSISVSGFSSGADFAIQFHIAFSQRVVGAAAFAGQPYHCDYPHGLRDRFRTTPNSSSPH